MDGRDAPPMPPPKPAKFAGRCGGCPHWIEIDEPIVWVRGMGTRCRECCVRIWGILARVHFGLPPGYQPPPLDSERPKDPVDRPIVTDHTGRIDMRRPKVVPQPSRATGSPRRPRTYEELFPDDD